MDKADRDFRHETPARLGEALEHNPELRTRWEALTELARNEWICWMSSAKKQETRDKRFARLQEEILANKRRPCCWPGCPHRRESARKFF